jgi:hypothetical protein
MKKAGTRMASILITGSLQGTKNDSLKLMHAFRADFRQAWMGGVYVTPILPSTAVPVSRYVSDTAIRRYAVDTVSVRYREKRKIELISILLNPPPIRIWKVSVRV